MPIDWDFIAAREGKDIAVGYLPVDKNKKVLGKSGLTVGTGFDLGMHSEAEIDGFEIPSELKQKLKPFAGKKADEILAIGSLVGSNTHRWPKSTVGQVVDDHRVPGVGTFNPKPAMQDNFKPLLELDSTELRQLWIASKKQMTAAIVANYNRSLRLNKPHGVGFDQLPSDLQTAIVSFCFQFGQNIGMLKHKHDRRREYWNAVTSQNWELARKLLDTRFLDYRDRRQREMRLLERGADQFKLITARTDQATDDADEDEDTE